MALIVAAPTLRQLATPDSLMLITSGLSEVNTTLAAEPFGITALKVTWSPSYSTLSLLFTVNIVAAVWTLTVISAVLPLWVVTLALVVPFALP